MGTYKNLTEGFVVDIADWANNETHIQITGKTGSRVTITYESGRFIVDKHGGGVLEFRTYTHLAGAVMCATERLRTVKAHCVREGWIIEETGGGCNAYTYYGDPITIPGRAPRTFSVMVTSDVEAPYMGADCDIMVGVYWADGHKGEVDDCGESLEMRTFPQWKGHEHAILGAAEDMLHGYERAYRDAHSERGDIGRTAWEAGCASPCPGCESTGPEHFQGCDSESEVVDIPQRAGILTEEVLADGMLVEKLATAFRDEMAVTLSKETRAHIDAENAIRDDDGACYSHAYCDANVVMDAAWEAVMGFTPSTADDDSHMRLWNKAWDLVKKEGFDSEAPILFPGTLYKEAASLYHCGAHVETDDIDDLERVPSKGWSKGFEPTCATCGI